MGHIRLKNFGANVFKIYFQLLLCMNTAINHLMIKPLPANNKGFDLQKAVYEDLDAYLCSRIEHKSLREFWF